MVEATQDTGSTQATGAVEESFPNCSFLCPQVSGSVAPTCSPNGTGPVGANVVCAVMYNGGDQPKAQGKVDNSGNWRVQFNNLPLTGSDQGHMSSFIWAIFLDATGTQLCTCGPFGITVVNGAGTCS